MNELRGVSLNKSEPFLSNTHVLLMCKKRTMAWVKVYMHSLVGAKLELWHLGLIIALISF